MNINEDPITANNARRFFQEPNIAPILTGVNVELISRFSVILRIMSCGYKFKAHAFQRFCMQTAEIYDAPYPWFYMSSAVHKILCHGANIINHVSLPIGKMCEEVQESRNKDLRTKYNGIFDAFTSLIRFLYFLDL